MANLYKAFEVTTMGDDFGIDSQYNYSGTRTFLVTVDTNQVDNSDFMEMLLTTSGVPLIGATHPRNDRLIVKDIKAAVTTDPHFYSVTVTYADRFGADGQGLDREAKADPATKDKYPWEVNPVMQIETQDEFTEVAKYAYGFSYVNTTDSSLAGPPDKDTLYYKFEGTQGTSTTLTSGCVCPVTNTARDPFLDSPVKTIPSMTFQYTFAVKSADRDIQDWLKLNKTVNYNQISVNFAGGGSLSCEPYTLLLQNIRAEFKWFIDTDGSPVVKDPIPYWDMSVTFAWKEDGWTTNLIDQGLFAYYPDKDNKLVKQKITIPFKPVKGQASTFVEEPRPLKSGKPLELVEWEQYYKTDDEGEESLPGQTKVYVLRYLLYKPGDWDDVLEDLSDRV